MNDFISGNNTAEEFWRHFCELSKLNADTPEIIINEMKYAFFGGVAELLTYMFQNVSDMSERDGMIIMSKITMEVKAFLNEYTKKFEEEKKRGIN